MNMNGQPTQKEVIEMPVTEEVRPQEGAGTPPPDIYLEGIDIYKDIVGKLKGKLGKLIEEGLMSEAVANKIIDEFSFNAFQQAVKVEYRP